MAGSNPFAGSSASPLPGGGGNYLGTGENYTPARHIVMLEKLTYKPPGFKTPQGATIADFQVLCTDTTNHKVGASYAVYHGFDKVLGKGNTVAHLAEFRSVLLGRPVMPAEVTDEMLAAVYGVEGFPLEQHDPEGFAILGAGGYRGLIMVAVCWDKPPQKNPQGHFTVVKFLPLGESDMARFKKEQPDLYAQCFPDEAQAAG